MIREVIGIGLVLTALASPNWVSASPKPSCSSALHPTSLPRNRPPPYFAPFHQERRQTLLDQLPPSSALIVVGASPTPLDWLGAIEGPLKQEPNFQYLTGFPEADAVAILSNHKGSHFSLVVRPSSDEYDGFTRPPAGPEGAQSIYGADRAFPNTRLSQAIGESVRGARHIYLVPANDNEPLNQRVHRILRRHRPGTPVVDATPRVHRMRLFKTPYEVSLLRRAIRITEEGILHAMRASVIPEGGRPKSEREIEADLAHEYIRRGGIPGFPHVVGAGPNSVLVLYVDNDSTAKRGDLVLVDTGASYGNYTADLARTWPISGKFTKEQKQIYETVLQAELAAIRIVKPGTTFKELHDVAARRLTQGLVDVGILEGDPERLFRRGAYLEYFYHVIGHPLGMEFHDPYGASAGDYWDKLDKLVLEPGMVIAIEPGLYFSSDTVAENELDPKWAEIGVRLEDNLLVTEDGYINLSRRVPKTVSAIEALLAQ